MTPGGHALALAGLLLMSTPALAVGQGTPTPQGGAPAATPSLADVLDELRALRADLNDAMAAGLRAQLLVARLALQEQRISGVGREMAEVAEKLAANERAKPMAAMLKNFGGAEAGKPGSEPVPPNPFFDAIRHQAEAIERSDGDLKARYEELSRLLAEEQSRWSAFNAQLEALEQRAGAAGRR